MRPEEVHALAVAAGLTHEQAITATAIAWAESKGKDGLPNPSAIGDVDLEDDKWGPSVGLWQVRSLRADTGTGRSRDIERLGDPAFNAQAMFLISNGGANWTPWSVWKNGRYLTHIDAVRAAVTTGGPVALVRGGIAVKPHVQAFANACQAATGADSYGTYNGHSPPEGPTQALDIFNPDNTAGYALQDRVVEFAQANQKRFGIRYIIRRRQIWNIERAGEGWRSQSATGNRTADHFDHVHITFYATADDVEPEPNPAPQGDLNMLTFRYIFDGLDWVFDGPSGLFFQLNDERQITEVLDPLGVKALGKVSEATHRRYSEVAATAGFKG